MIGGFKNKKRAAHDVPDVVGITMQIVQAINDEKAIAECIKNRDLISHNRQSHPPQSEYRTS